MYTRFLEADSVEEFEAAYKTFKEDELQYRVSGAGKANSLDEAIELAKQFKANFQSFTYDDIGLPVEKRSERKAFRDWASHNDIAEWQGNKLGTRGFQGTQFRPFYLDGNGHEILSECLAEGRT